MKPDDELFKQLQAEARKVYEMMARGLADAIHSHNFVQTMGLRPLHGYAEFLYRCQPEFVLGNAFAPGFTIKAGFKGWKENQAPLLAAVKSRVSTFNN